MLIIPRLSSIRLWSNALVRSYAQLLIVSLRSRADLQQVNRDFSGEQITRATHSPCSYMRQILHRYRDKNDYVCCDIYSDITLIYFLVRKAREKKNEGKGLKIKPRVLVVMRLLRLVLHSTCAYPFPHFPLST